MNKFLLLPYFLSKSPEVLSYQGQLYSAELPDYGDPSGASRAAAKRIDYRIQEWLQESRHAWSGSSD
jgi:hypothetical protein